MLRRVSSLGVGLAVLLLTISGCKPSVGIDVSPQKANATIHQRFRIPALSEKVRFVTSVRSSAVNAWLSEEEFLKWAHDRGWPLEPVKREDDRSIVLLREDGSLEVVPMSRGYRFLEEGRVGFGGAYDTERGIAGVNYFSN